MLVLTRNLKHPDVDLSIGDVQIRVTVVALKGGKVKLAFTCPDEVIIRRPDAKKQSAAKPLEACACPPG